MPADAFIQCRVTPEMKTLVRAFAEREQITESALVKQLLQVVLRTAALQGVPKFDALDRPNRDSRLILPQRVTVLVRSWKGYSSSGKPL
jgi:hypothetical protein